MSTGIEYLDKAWNLTAGCSPAGPGCTHCYAARFARRIAANPAMRGLVELARDGNAQRPDGIVIPDNAGPWSPRWTGKVRTFPDRLEVPKHWRKPRAIGVCFMSDLFHQGVPDDFILAAIRVMAACPQHAFVVLTKRPKRMQGIMLPPPHGGAWPLPNAYLGASASTQADVDAAAPHLAKLAGAGWKTWLSLEPLLAPVDLDIDIGQGVGDLLSDRLAGVVVGAETGPGARPCKAEWIESVVAQCEAAGVPMFVKAAPPRSGVGPEDDHMRLDHWVPRPWPRELAWRKG